MHFQKTLSNTSQNHRVFTDEEMRRQRARLAAMLQGKGYTISAGRLHNTNGLTPIVQQLITRLYQ